MPPRRRLTCTKRRHHRHDAIRHEPIEPSPRRRQLPRHRVRDELCRLRRLRVELDRDPQRAVGGVRVQRGRKQGGYARDRVEGVDVVFAVRLGG